MTRRVAVLGQRTDFSSLIPYTLEEVYEVAEAIDKQDFSLLKEELGDLLLQIVFYAQMAREQDLFDLDDVAKSISDKLVRRHPKIFEEGVDSDKATWDDIKEAERQAKNEHRPNTLLDDIPGVLPQLLRAWKIQERTSTVGFDWQETRPVLLKIAEELGELEEALDAGEAQERLAEELGDLLFSAVNLGRHLNISAEEALRKSNEKFMRRFQHNGTAEALKGTKYLPHAQWKRWRRAWQQPNSLSPDCLLKIWVF